MFIVNGQCKKFLEKYKKKIKKQQKNQKKITGCSRIKEKTKELLVLIYEKNKRKKRQASWKIDKKSKKRRQKKYKTAAKNPRKIRSCS